MEGVGLLVVMYEGRARVFFVRAGRQGRGEMFRSFWKEGHDPHKGLEVVLEDTEGDDRCIAKVLGMC